MSKCFIFFNSTLIEENENAGQMHQGGGTTENGTERPAPSKKGNEHRMSYCTVTQCQDYESDLSPKMSQWLGKNHSFVPLIPSFSSKSYSYDPGLAYTLTLWILITQDFTRSFGAVSECHMPLLKNWYQLQKSLLCLHYGAVGAPMLLDKRRRHFCFSFYVL